MADAKHFLERVVRWAATCPEILAVGLAGSWARGTATEDSDIDVVVVVDDVPQLLIGRDWMRLFGDYQHTRDEDWGHVVSRRVLYSDGIEAEFGFTTVAWAGTPLDDGTVRVIRDGFKVLYDPIDLLANAVADARMKNTP